MGRHNRGRIFFCFFSNVVPPDGPLLRVTYVCAHSVVQIGVAAPARVLVQNMESVESFDRYYQRDYKSVMGLAFVMTGSHWIAEELAQDAMADAHRRWSTVGNYDNPGAWVRRVMINKKVTLSRRLTNEAKAMLRLRSRSVTQTVELPERTGEVWAAVRALPQRQAQVIALFYWEDLPIAEVAEILEVGVETVKTHLKRGRATLASELKVHWEAPAQ